MGFVDRERYNRFEQFLAKHLRVFVDGATRGFEARGPGVLVYHAPDDQFNAPTGPLRFDYHPKTQVDAAHQSRRDELLQGMLDRYQPPGEAVIVAIYPDNTYDITRVVIQRTEANAPKPN